MIELAALVATLATGVALAWIFRPMPLPPDNTPRWVYRSGPDREDGAE